MTDITIKIALAGAAALALGACATTATTTPIARTAEDGERTVGGGHEKADFMADYDANGDGAVTLAEFSAERQAGYNLRDANGDGSVHEEEYVAEYEVRLEQDLASRREMQIKQAHVRFDVLDKDDDEAMTFDEFNASGSRMFSALDTNEDGVVDDADTAEAF